jgi:thymidylate kinase
LIGKKEIGRMLYLIEGLDCSGKKTVAAKVKEELSKKGIFVDIRVGSTGSKIISSLSNKLVHTYNIKPGSGKDRFRKGIYCIEPIIDKYIPIAKNKIILKISSHYRFFSRAYAENDIRLIKFYEKHSKHMVKYDGKILLTADFDDRIARHRKDVAAGRTDKIEEKRFFNQDRNFFSKWQFFLEEMMNMKSLDTSKTSIDSIVNIICKEILSLIKVM